MNVKKCDRCGKIFEENQPIADGEKRIQYEFTRKIKNAHSLYEPLFVKIDLCDDCLKEFHAFMNKYESDLGVSISMDSDTLDDAEYERRYNGK